MIKVLVAEDEIPLLRGVKKMIENINPEFEVIMCAHNGKEAIEYLEQNQVDVIFTDINMPLVDGLEILDYANKKYPQVMKIVISGYSDFGYAQQAIKCGVKDYLLKPIIKEELEQILFGISKQYKQSTLKRKKDTLTDAVYKGKKDSLDEWVQIICFCAGPFITADMEESVVECNFWHGIDIESFAKTLLSSETDVFSFEKNQENERILLIMNEKETDLKMFTESFVSRMQEKGVHITAVYHEGKIEIAKIPEVAHQLRRKIQDNILFCEGLSISDTEERIHLISKDGLYLPGKGVTISNKMLLLKETEDFFSKHKVTQKECISILGNLLQNTMEKCGSQEDWEQEKNEIIWNLLLYSSRVEELFQNLYQMLCEKKDIEKEKTTESLMVEVEEYIKKHMSEPITSTVLASHFGLVAPYLSKLFKEYSGYTLAQYIQKVRLERAKRLLDIEEEILAKDVAEIIGYTNPLYFSKVFKKNVGIYPSEYRKKSRGNRRDKKEADDEI